MKKFAFIGFVILVLILYLRLDQSVPSPSVNPIPSAQPAASASVIESMDVITHQDQTYHYAYTVVDNLDKLHLYPNFKDQALSQDLVSQQNCRVLVNGGFYDQNNDPLGWFVSQNQEIKKLRKSNLFNGFLSLDNNNQLTIAPNKPTQPSRLGLQSGPLLVFDSKPLLLKIKADESRRRLVAIQTKDDQLAFLVIIGDDSSFSGPLLADTPAVVLAIGQKMGESFTNALNLDGGSASTFYTSELHLKEFSYIGSYFCEV